MKPDEQALAMSEVKHCHAAELERQQLLAECHERVASIGHKRYAIGLLKAARNGLLLYCNYKECRQYRRRGSG